MEIKRNLNHHEYDLESEPEEEKKPVRIFCPQGYEFQKKVEEIKGRQYCREHCGREYDKYVASQNTTSCYWIAKGGK